MTYGTSSGKTSKISALDITESHCNCTLIGDPGCTIIPKQKSAKFSGNTATYVVPVKGSAAGFYSDTVDVNVVFKTGVTRADCEKFNEAIFTIMEEDLKIPKENVYTTFQYCDDFGVQGKFL